jgi:ferredoxin-type protein NapH
MSGGGHIIVLRRVTMGLVFAAVIISLAFDSGLGTPSAFGIGGFSLLCPLGGLEAMVASKAFLPVAALSLLVVVVLTLLFGRAWCAWGCPAPAIRSFFRRTPKTASGASTPQPCPSSDKRTAGQAEGGDGFLDRLRVIIRGDKRLAMLFAVLLASFIAGFPLFCLICPIGLSFGTVVSLWHLFVYKQVTLSVLVFPLCLLVELVAYRRWCLNLCPIAALLAIIGRAARLFRPRVDATKCLLYTTGGECKACAQACGESIDLHAPDAASALRNCTRCAQCQAVCPARAINIKVKPEDPVS